MSADASASHETALALQPALSRLRALMVADNSTCSASGVEEMLSTLAALDEWRVLVDGTRNLGHQASTVLLMRRLIELTTFTGVVTVVFVDHDVAYLGSTSRKLALMFPGLDPDRIGEACVAYASCSTIRFLPASRSGELGGGAAFGFTGGADDLSLNGAALLRTRWFMRLQPWQWDDVPARSEDTYFQASRIEQASGQHLYLLEAWPDTRRLHVHVPVPGPNSEAYAAAAYWYASEQRFDEALAQRTHRWLRWRGEIDVDAEARPLLWPVYGLQHFAADVPRIVSNLLMVAGYVSTSAGRPVVVAAFGSFTGLLASQETLVAPPGSPPRRFEELPGPHLRKGPAVVVARIGEVPMDLFHEALLRADLPPVIEGQASANLLASHERPFVQLRRPEFVDDEMGASPAALALRDADASADTDALLGVADVLLGATPRPAALFPDAACRRPARDDKLFVGLAALREVILGDGF